MKTSKPAVSTLGELKASGWKSISIRDEIRKNLIAKIKKDNVIYNVATSQLDNINKLKIRQFEQILKYIEINIKENINPVHESGKGRWFNNNYEYLSLDIN